LSSSWRGPQWWASSRRNARGAFLGASVLVLALTGTSVAVWLTPATSPITRVTELTKAIQQQQQLKGDNEDLKSQVARLTAEIDSKQDQIDAKNTQLASGKNQLASATASLDSLRSQLAQVQGQLQQAQSSAARAIANSSHKVAPTSVVAAAVTAPSKAQLLNPASPYFGMYTEQAPFNYGSFDSTVQKIGATPSMVGYFAGWDQTFRADAVTKAWGRNMMPMMTWESRPIDDANNVVDSPTYSLPNIIAGNFDAYLHQYAKDIVATGLPLAIRLDHEMNGTWYPWATDDGNGHAINGNNPGDYVKMWQHVHDIFDAEGADNYVIWVWAPNRIDNLPASHKTLAYTQSLYPGDADVDWIGMSGYLRPPFSASQTYTFDETFGPTLAQLRAVAKKPIMLAEVGASETGGHKPTWMTNFFAGLNAPENSDIIGFSWFNLAVSSYVQGSLATNDWRIDSRAESLAAFSAGLLAPDSRFKLVPAK
jgi:mannan endo-1,4-beta-mannosidase